MSATDPTYRKLKAGLEGFGLVETLVWNELTGEGCVIPSSIDP